MATKESLFARDATHASGLTHGADHHAHVASGLRRDFNFSLLESMRRAPPKFVGMTGMGRREVQPLSSSYRAYAERLGQKPRKTAQPALLHSVAEHRLAYIVSHLLRRVLVALVVANDVRA
jgi:hypothetical protein